MKTDLVALVIVPLEGRFCRVGTGYPVGPRQILTARHVLGDFAVGAEVEVRFPSSGNLKAKIVWRGDEHLDAAVLELAPGENFGGKERFPEVAPLREYGPEHVKPVEWYGKGYASAGRETSPNGSWKRNPVDVGGHVQIDGSARFQAELSTWPIAPAMWMGISGAPLFTNEDGVLRAVLTEVPTSFDGKRFHAVALVALLKDEGFRRAIQWEDRVQRLDELGRKVAGILGEYAARVSDAVNAVLRRWDRLPIEPTTAQDVAHRLVQLTVPNLLKVGNLTHHELRAKQALPAAGAFYATLQYVVPLLYDRGVIQLARTLLGAVVTLPVQSLTVAEIIMAGADDRPTSFVPGGPHPAGAARVALAPVTMPNKDDFLRDLREELIARLHLLRASKDSLGSEKPQYDLINIALRDKADPTHNPDDPARLYLVLDAQYRALAEAIATAFPELRVVVLDPKEPDLPEEQAILDLLLSLLKRELGPK